MVNNEENTEHKNDEITIKEQTELGQVFENLDKKENIDHNTNITTIERGCLTVIESYHKMGLMEFINVNDVMKNLSVSIKGWGRNSKESIAIGDRQLKASSGLSRLITPQNKE